MKLHLLLPLLLSLVIVSCTSVYRDGSNKSSTAQLEATKGNSLAQALAAADQASVSGLKTPADQEAYRIATEKAVALWLAQTKDQTRGQRVDAGQYQLHATWPKNLLFDELIPAHTIKGSEMKRHIRRDGVGAPFVAHWDYTKERKAAEPFMAEGGYLAPTTATLAFRPGSKGERLATLTLHDPRITEKVILSGSHHPLSCDTTAVGEYLLSMKGARMAGIGALLKSEKYMDKLGLIALERPAKDRIPVIFVHGLMSRPATWQNIFNELSTDAEIQAHYQCFFFRYPSGVPVIYSAAKLRMQLAVLHQKLSALGNHTLAHQMVLVGHSMGGLVSKSQVQASGDRLWVNIFGTTPDKLSMPKEEREALRQYLEFQPNPNVSRVIFVATPHRGSSLADSTLANIGRTLINLPGRTLGNAFDILQGQAPQNSLLRELLAKGIPTSVDNLSPNSTYVKTSISLPLRPGLHIHSIIGNKKQLPLTDPKCSDGFVPYNSSHLDGVESEFIVPFGHSAHEHPDAVKEMRRILLLHLAKLPSA